ncbi:MAG: hypothetical protein JWQ89_2525 [Devosia sp.]|uniref:hypothetical protein n=1 Tax=Devosia sp. TaxID=1871048 RepID=UPI0026034A4B|nr:hypothetical protein [Devosia sp.]MDB5540798.1 hypothetical protein [Devosia sp.]
MSTTKPARTVTTPGDVTAKSTDAGLPAVAPMEAAPDFSKMSPEEKDAYLLQMHQQQTETHRLMMEMHRRMHRETASMPVEVVHPSVEEVMASNPDKATMTKDGIYVPRVTSANPEQVFKR